ncbi:MAG: helicase HerA-like domain-containing protein, partial [Hyphomicrobium sp.]
MQLKEASPQPAPDRLFSAFEQSITWEDDIWRADPVDVAEVHAKARRKFSDLLTGITSGKGPGTQDRILLFHGQSGAGKTHLLRALRTTAHRDGTAYFGYAQMTPDVANYADYYLRRLVHSLEKTYDPDASGESALQRLTGRMVADAAVNEKDLLSLREANLDEGKLAKLVLKIADDVVAAPKYATRDLDINVVRALLYLERHDPRIDQRVRQYLHGRPLTELAHHAVAALDPNDGEDRAFEIIAALGGLMWTVDSAALVFCVDQVEDLRFFSDAEERFQRAVRDLIQIANRVPNAILIISCLEDFYGQVRGVLAQSYIDRIEKAGPVALLESRTPEEARLIIAKRLQHLAEQSEGGAGYPDPSAFFGPQFFEEFAGLSTRRLLEHAHSRLRSKTAPEDEEPDEDQEADKGGGSFISRLAAALGLGLADDGDKTPTASGVDNRESWERFQNASEAEIPSDERELLDVLGGALGLAKEEWAGTIQLNVERLDLGDDLAAVDFTLKHKGGFSTDGRVFICNKPTQGGGLKRQLDRVLANMGEKQCFMLRASDYPPNRKNQTATAFRKFRENGGRPLMVPIAEWERMMMVREFHTHHRQDPGFMGWLGNAKLLSNLPCIIQLLRLDLLGRALPKSAAAEAEAAANGTKAGRGRSLLGALDDITPVEAAEPAVEEEELPLSVILDENASGSSIVAGREIRPGARPVTLNKDVLKRHAAVLGGSGSGKTTLALSLIEQLLLRGIPAVLIDRKGDLCSYANPDVWRDNDEEFSERRGDREKLADAIDVAVFTPGRASGRPISITLLPNGINELPEHEQQLLANLSSAALGEMLHLKNSATHQKQSGTLSVALRILGARHSREVTLTDLIHLLEDEDPELSDLTQRMDPSGKLRRDLVAQLDSLRHRNSSLFEGGGEPMSMEAFLGLGQFEREGRTRLSDHLHGLPRRQREHPLLGVAVSFRGAALLPAQSQTTNCRPSSCSTRPTSTFRPTPSRPRPEPLQSLLKRARSAGLGIMLATQSQATSTTRAATRSRAGSSAACARIRRCASSRRRSPASLASSRRRYCRARRSASSTSCRRASCVR